VVVPLKFRAGAKVTSPVMAFAVHVHSGLIFMYCGSEIRGFRSIVAATREFPDQNTRSFDKIFPNEYIPVPKGKTTLSFLAIGGI
jgi:hypothetical protein